MSFPVLRSSQEDAPLNGHHLFCVQLWHLVYLAAGFVQPTVSSVCVVLCTDELCYSRGSGKTVFYTTGSLTVQRREVWHRCDSFVASAVMPAHRLRGHDEFQDRDCLGRDRKTVLSCKWQIWFREIRGCSGRKKRKLSRTPAWRWNRDAWGGR